MATSKSKSVSDAILALGLHEARAQSRGTGVRRVGWE
jgi:hypothetical protein